MKKISISAMLLLLLLSCSQWVKAAIIVRPYGTVGGTVIDLPGANDWDTLKSGGGLQAVYDTFPNINFGLDLAYMYSYYYQVIYGADVEYLNLLAVCEYHYGIVLLQAGLGPYFGVGINDTVPFGMMFSGGVDIPINNMLSIALLARFDLVFENWYKGDGVTFMPGFMGGFSVKF